MELVLAIIGVLHGAWLWLKEAWAMLWTAICFVPWLIYWAIVQAWVNRKNERKTGYEELAEKNDSAYGYKPRHCPAKFEHCGDCNIYPCLLGCPAINKAKL